MKIRTTGLILLISLFAISCQQKNEDTALQKRVEELEIKLEATEAQLLNISTELSKCKGKYLDSTQLEID